MQAYKCYLTLCEDFIWMNMDRKVKSILRTCQTPKYPNQHTYIEMGNFVVHNKNELLYIDFLRLLPQTSHGIKNLMVCTDVFI